MSRLRKLSALAIFAGAIGSANATFISFTSLADAIIGEGPISTYTQDGITVSFAAGYGTATAYAYLDGKGSKPVAGLGVCKTLLTHTAAFTDNECNPGTDDNIQSGEWVRLSFSTDVLIDKAWYNNNHELGLVTGNQILVNGVAKGVVDVSAYGGKGRGLVDDDYFLSAGSSITYAFNPAAGSGRQFYIDAMDLRAVPEPATIGLFGLGLGMLGFFLRRRKN